MFGFEYRGRSTATILDTPLLLVSFDAMSSLGSSRSKIEGEQTISRFITNEYGTLYDPLSFTYGLIKSDRQPFTAEEARTIETWLTSPKLSSELKITDCNEEQVSYYGLFTNTEWQSGDGSLTSGLLFTFAVNGAYPYRSFSGQAWTAAQYNDEESPTIMSDVLDNGEFTIDCYSDELEEYVYPIIRIEAVSSDYDSSFTLINLTDGPDKNKQTKITTEQWNVITLDCQHCMVYDEINMGNGKYIKNSALKYKDIGWKNIDNIYWPRLIPGENSFQITGNVTITYSYKAPYKKIGGWAI